MDNDGWSLIMGIRLGGVVDSEIEKTECFKGNECQPIIIKLRIGFRFTMVY